MDSDSSAFDLKSKQLASSQLQPSTQFQQLLTAHAETGSKLQQLVSGQQAAGRALQELTIAQHSTGSEVQDLKLFAGNALKELKSAQQAIGNELQELKLDAGNALQDLNTGDIKDLEKTAQDTADSLKHALQQLTAVGKLASIATEDSIASLLAAEFGRQAVRPGVISTGADVLQRFQPVMTAAASAWRMQKIASSERSAR